MATTPEFDDLIVGLVSANQIRLRAYLLAMVRVEADVDDLMQETNLAIWKQREKYNCQRDFFPWACGIAFVEVLRLRRSRARDRLWFDQPLLERLTADFIQQVDDHDQRWEALTHCMQKLTSRERWYIEARFRAGRSVDQLASETGKPAKTIYWLLSRIRERLFQCVRATLKQQDHPMPGHGS